MRVRTHHRAIAYRDPGSKACIRTEKSALADTASTAYSRSRANLRVVFQQAVVSDRDMGIDDHMIPHLRPRANDAARGEVGSRTDPRALCGDNRGVDKSHWKPADAFCDAGQSLARRVVAYGDEKTDILPGKPPGRLLNRSVHNVSTEPLSLLFRGIVGVAEYLPWRTRRAVAVSRRIHFFGDPDKLGSQTPRAYND
jgi:hypothetical protein